MSNVKSYNKIILCGRVGKEPEFKSTGNKMARLSIATTDGYMDKDNVWQESTEWHNVTAWGYTAEKINKNVNKGDLVHVEGRLKYSEWENKEGKKQFGVDIVIENIIALDKSKKNNNTNSKEKYDNMGKSVKEQEEEILNNK